MYWDARSPWCTHSIGKSAFVHMCAMCLCCMRYAKHARQSRKYICTAELDFSLIRNIVEIQFALIGGCLDIFKISQLHAIKDVQQTRSMQTCAHLISAMLNSTFDIIVYKTLRKYRNICQIIEISIGENAPFKRLNVFGHERILVFVCFIDIKFRFNDWVVSHLKTAMCEECVPNRDCRQNTI